MPVWRALPPWARHPADCDGSQHTRPCWCPGWGVSPVPGGARPLPGGGPAQRCHLGLCAGDLPACTAAGGSDGATPDSLLSPHGRAHSLTPSRLCSSVRLCLHMCWGPWGLQKISPCGLCSSNPLPPPGSHKTTESWVRAGLRGVLAGGAGRGGGTGELGMTGLAALLPRGSAAALHTGRREGLALGAEPHPGWQAPHPAGFQVLVRSGRLPIVSLECVSCKAQAVYAVSRSSYVYLEGRCDNCDGGSERGVSGKGPGALGGPAGDPPPSTVVSMPPPSCGLHAASATRRWCWTRRPRPRAVRACGWWCGRACCATARATPSR